MGMIRQVLINKASGDFFCLMVLSQ